MRLTCCPWSQTSCTLSRSRTKLSVHPQSRLVPKQSSNCNFCLSATVCGQSLPKKKLFLIAQDLLPGDGGLKIKNCKWKMWPFPSFFCEHNKCKKLTFGLCPWGPKNSKTLIGAYQKMVQFTSFYSLHLSGYARLHQLLLDCAWRTSMLTLRTWRMFFTSSWSRKGRNVCSPSSVSALPSDSWHQR